MIIIYKKNAIPKTSDVIKINDVYFNKHTSEMLDEKAKAIIRTIDHSEMIDQYNISSRFDGTRLNIDKLSTGCKTALNILYNPDRIFDISECGENALEVIYSLEAGKVYCDYPMIAFDMKEVEAIDSSGTHVFKDYEDLRKWWKNED
jgi:hypothetical protein